MLPAPGARPRRQRVRLGVQFEKWKLVRLPVLTLHRARVAVFVEKLLEFARVKRCRLLPTGPQGELPSVVLASPYSSVRIGGNEYKRSNLNRRLIDHRKSMARLEDVTFAAARVQQFIGVVSVDLFSQPVYVDFDRV